MNSLYKFNFYLLSIGILILSAGDLRAQDTAMGNMKMDMSGMDMHDMHDSSKFMSSSYSTHLPMTMDGSGTSWLPEQSPMNAMMWNKKTTQIMLHGAFFVRGDFQNINHPAGRGHEYRLDAPNWLMAVIDQKAGKKGLLNFNLMMSLDRLTEGGSGYPLLFQTGESWRGQPLIDRQHPHDLIAELSVAYTYGFTKDIDLTAYFGYPGEPTIGPPVFMHRPSAMYDPDAPIAHHWQDATHITFGVGTIGFRYKIMKIEGSIFTGREPDENRLNFDKPRFDSYSGRISVNPDKHFALQSSYAYIKSPEALYPAENLHRVTSSLIYSNQWKKKQSINVTEVWGINITDSHRENAVLIEGTYQINKFAAYGRYEWVQKDAVELGLGTSESDIYEVHALTAGTAFNFLTFYHIALIAGVQSTLNLIGNSLTGQYGQTPVSAEVYLMVRAASIAGLVHKKSTRSMNGMQM